MTTKDTEKKATAKKGTRSTNKKVATKSALSKTKQTQLGTVDMEQGNTLKENETKQVVYIETRKKPWTVGYTVSVAVAIVLCSLAVLVLINNMVQTALRIRLG